MTQSKLRQVLGTFEAAREPLSLSQIAHELDLSVAQLEGMIQYWVRKGKIRQSVALTECGSCGHGSGDCPFILDLPRQYELATENDPPVIPLSTIPITCSRH